MFACGLVGKQLQGFKRLFLAQIHTQYKQKLCKHKMLSGKIASTFQIYLCLWVEFSVFSVFTFIFLTDLFVR